MGWSVQAAMWWCASGYVVVAHEILVSAQGPLVLGFWAWGLGVWGLGLTIMTAFLQNKILISFNPAGCFFLSPVPVKESH